jgi:hypothetical protein
MAPGCSPLGAARGAARRPAKPMASVRFRLLSIHRRRLGGARCQNRMDRSTAVRLLSCEPVGLPAACWTIVGCRRRTLNEFRTPRIVKARRKPPPPGRRRPDGPRHRRRGGQQVRLLGLSRRADGVRAVFTRLMGPTWRRIILILYAIAADTGNVGQAFFMRIEKAPRCSAPIEEDSANRVSAERLGMRCRDLTTQRSERDNG